jgi:hypothetical protein
VKAGKKLTNAELLELQDGSKYAGDEIHGDPIADALQQLKVKYKNNAYNASPVVPKTKRKLIDFCKSCKVPEKYIISYKNKNKKIWDMFVLMLAMYNSMMIPMDQAFSPEFKFYQTSIIMDGMIDFVFLIDIILMFSTSYLDPKGAEVFESNRIAGSYISELRFKIDALSMLGSGAFTWIHPIF